MLNNHILITKKLVITNFLVIFVLKQIINETTHEG